MDLLNVNVPFYIDAIREISVSLIIVGGIVFLIKMFGKTLLERYYKTKDKKEEQYLSLENKLTDIVEKITSVATSLENHKLFYEKFQQDMNNTFERVYEKVNEKHATLEARINAVDTQYKSIIKDCTIQEGEHYKELKGKISTVYAEVASLKQDLNRIKTAHNHFHKEHQL